MFGKKFLQTSSSVVLSASLVSIAQYSSVFANDNAEIQSKVSPENNAGVLSVGEQNDDVVEKIFGYADPLEEAKDSEILDSMNYSSYEETANSVENKESQVAKEENSDDTPVEGSEKIVEKSPLEKLNELEKQRKEITLKFKALKKLYDEGMEKLNSEDKELVKEINKIKDENGIWRLRTWDEICNDTPLVLKIFLFLLLLELVLEISWCIVSAYTGKSYSQVKKDTFDFVLELIFKAFNSCVNAGKFVGNKLSEGFEATKKLCSDFKAQLSGGYELLPVEENY